jgi:hypothetical protein
MGNAGLVRRQERLKTVMLLQAFLDYLLDSGERIIKEGGAQVYGP